MLAFSIICHIGTNEPNYLIMATINVVGLCIIFALEEALEASLKGKL